MPLTSSVKPELRTPRLYLRRWREADLEIFAKQSADPRVMEYFPKPLNRAECADAMQRIHTHFERHGFGYWAIEAPDVAPFIGYTGLAVPSWEASFTPCVEVGWRLGYEFWGKGYATEAAQAALDFAFTELGLKEVVSFTVPANTRSRAVMERIGMVHSPSEDFKHPRLPEGDPLQRHVFYRISRGGQSPLRVCR